MLHHGDLWLEVTGAAGALIADKLVPDAVLTGPTSGYVERRFATCADWRRKGRPSDAKRSRLPLQACYGNTERRNDEHSQLRCLANKALFQCSVPAFQG